MRLRWVGLGVIIVMLIAWAAYALLSTPPAPIYVVEPMPLEQTVVATGRVESPARIEIGSTLLGVAVHVLVDDGDTVRSGELLLRLRADEAEAALAQAQAAEAQARARLRQLEQVDLPAAREALLQARLREAQARRDFERARQLAAEGYQAHAEAEARQEALDLAQSQLRSAQLQLTALEADGAARRNAEAALLQAQAAVRQAQARLEDTALEAPVAGTIIQRRVEPGDVVSPGEPLLILSQAGPTKLVVQLDERNLARVALDQPALASADAYPERRFHARVSRIGPAVDAARGTVELELAVAEPPPYLRPDMTVSVDIVTGRRERALVVPRAALRHSDGETWLLVERSGEQVRQPVQLGLEGEQWVEIVRGVDAGERVLLPREAGQVAVPGQMWGER